MIRIVTPVPLDQLLAVWFEHGAGKPWQVSTAILQGVRGESIGFYEGDFIIAAAVFYPVGRAFELAFACRPEAAACMLPIVRYARLTVRRMSQDTRIRAYCRRDNIAGRRLAWLIGLRPAGFAGDYKRYELIHDQISRRRQRPVRGARH